MSDRILNATAGAPLSGRLSELRKVRHHNAAAMSGRRPPQDSKVTRGDQRGPGR
jgi:hypothetical protein